MKKKIIFCCFGRRNNYLTANFLSRKNLLQKMYTDLYISRNQFNFLFFFKKFLNFKIINKILMRHSESIADENVKSFPGILIISLLKKFLSLNIYGLFVSEAKLFNNKITKDIKLLKGTTHVYSFRNDSLELFKYLKSNHPTVKKILEVAVAPAKFEKDIISSIKQNKFKKWEINLNKNRSFNEIIKKEIEEMKLSDYILVPSKFVKSKIISNYSINPKKINIIPYAISKNKNIKSIKIKKINKNRRLKVLTVGDVCLRKGVHHVYNVAKMLGDKFEFIWVGKSNLNSKGMKEASKYIKFIGEVPNNKINEYFSASDIYFLPSLCEGSAISLYEAYLNRLVLVYSKNCGFEINTSTKNRVIELDTKKMIVEFKKIYLNKHKKKFKKNKNIYSINSYEKKFSNFLDKIK